LEEKLVAQPSDIVAQYQTICNDNKTYPTANDKAAALAKLYAANAVLVVSEGIFTSNSEIQTALANLFNAGWKNIVINDHKDVVKNSYALSYGDHSCDIGTGNDQVAITGYWSITWTQNGDSWLILLNASNQRRWTSFATTGGRSGAP
jgi:ketosteroid isomerase-like protein